MSVALRDSKSAIGDADLLERVAAGDLEPLGTLFDRYAALVHGFVRRIAPREDADDVVQETFLRVARVAEGYDGRAPTARAWIFGVAYAIVRERRRALARLMRAITTMAKQDTARTAAPIGSARTEIERCLDMLAPEKREVVVLTEVMGMSGPEAASVLGIPVGTVWTRLHHARSELRDAREGDLA